MSPSALQHQLEHQKSSEDQENSAKSWISNLEVNWFVSVIEKKNTIIFKEDKYIDLKDAVILTSLLFPCNSGKKV